MKKHVGIPVILAALAACAPVPFYYKENAQVALAERNQTDCEVIALKRVPPDIQTRYIPPVYGPYPYCNGNGHCFYYQQVLSPGYRESFDANASLRRKVTAQCMAERGYTQINLPQCTTVQASTNREGPAASVFPPLSPKSCAQRLKSGRFRIVSPPG